MANNVDVIGDQSTIEQIIFNDFSETNGVFEDDVVTTIRNYAFWGATLTNAYFPNVTYLGENTFRGSTTLKTAEFPKLTSQHSTGYGFYGNSNMELVDWGLCNLPGNTFVNCSKLNKLVLRKTTEIQPCANTSVFAGTPYRSGGSGGKIYIPKALHDHLGDGTALDYQSATNWSVYHGYGTITWEILEDYTVDGTTTGDLYIWYPGKKWTGSVGSIPTMINDEEYICTRKVYSIYGGYGHPYLLRNSSGLNVEVRRVKNDGTISYVGNMASSGGTINLNAGQGTSFCLSIKTTDLSKGDLARLDPI